MRVMELIAGAMHAAELRGRRDRDRVRVDGGLIAMVVIASVMFLGQTTDLTFLNVGSAVSAS